MNHETPAGPRIASCRGTAAAHRGTGPPSGRRFARRGHGGHGASEATARRDLVLIERLGFLARTRGGARAVQRHSTLEEEFEIRQSRDRREKRLIAQRAAELLDDGTTPLPYDGTTAYALAHCLVHRHLTVITGALNIAQLLAGSAGIEVIVVGGRLVPLRSARPGPCRWTPSAPCTPTWPSSGPTASLWREGSETSLLTTRRRRER